MRVQWTRIWPMRANNYWLITTTVEPTSWDKKWRKSSIFIRLHFYVISTDGNHCVNNGRKLRRSQFSIRLTSRTRRKRRRCLRSFLDEHRQPLNSFTKRHVVGHVRWERRRNQPTTYFVWQRSYCRGKYTVIKWKKRSMSDNYSRVMATKLYLTVRNDP